MLSVVIRPSALFVLGQFPQRKVSGGNLDEGGTVGQLVLDFFLPRLVAVASRLCESVVGMKLLDLGVDVVQRQLPLLTAQKGLLDELGSRQGGPGLKLVLKIALV